MPRDNTWTGYEDIVATDTVWRSFTATTTNTTRPAAQPRQINTADIARWQDPMDAARQVDQPPPPRTAYTIRRAEPEDELPEFDEEEEVRMARPGGSVLDFDTTIGKHFKKSCIQEKKEEAVVGIEFENESVKEFSLPVPEGWRQHTEGSLRYYGVEFVLNPPQRLETAKKSVEELAEAAKAAKVKWTDSIRTSVHVHFDVTRYKVQDVINFAAVYWILEDFLSDFAGEHRKQNLFCLRAKDARYQVSEWTAAIFDKSPLRLRSLDNNLRYGSVNLAALSKFGSFEFRMMRGTSKVNEIHLWLDTLEAIRQFALKFNTPLALRNYFLKEVNAGDFPRAVLGDRLFSTLNSYRKDKTPLEESVREGFLNVESLLLSGGDWDFSKEIEEAKDIEKKRLEEEKVKKQAEREAFERAQRLATSIYRSISAYEAEDNQPIYVRSTDELLVTNGADI